MAALGFRIHPLPDRPAMTIDHQELSDDIRLVKLDGRLDIAGTESVSTRYTALTGANGKRIIVDLTGVSFLGSIGIRMLLSGAKANQQRGGRTVLLIAGNDSVARTLDVAGMTALMPVFATVEEAKTAILA
jgi:anti-sigma B factor antagonist